ncbi:MAG: hypothetical protein H7A21_17870 [Spirochaetales bacterium]|nr:hypothetical protein [Leptospiraceae bacterium]MCP5483309.1 hypothetical protein [Spirochaetales bacterium]
MSPKPKNEGQNQARTDAGKPKSRRRLLAALVLLPCLCTGEDPAGQLWHLLVQEELHVEMDFARVDLLRANPPQPAHLPDPVPLPAPRGSGAWPELGHNDEGAVCLASTSAYYFINEVGLRVRICGPRLARLATALEQLLRQAQSEQATYPRIHDDALQAGVYRRAELRTILSEVTIAVDGAPDEEHRISRIGVEAGRVLAYRAVDPGNRLPRRFSEAWFHVFAGDGFLTLVYALPRGDRYLALRFATGDQATQASAALHRIPNILQQLTEHAPGVEARVSEIGFARSVRDGYVEWSVGPDSGTTSFSFLTDAGFLYEYRGFVFSHSSFLVSEKSEADFRLGDTVESTQTLFDRTVLRPAHRHALEVRFDAAGQANAQNARRCLPGPSLCGSPGLAPAFVDTLSTGPDDDSVPVCPADAIQISELNARGIWNADRMEQDGRFIELSASSACSVDGMILFTPRAAISLQGKIAPGQPRVLAASAAYFSDRDSIIVHSDLRYLHSYDAIDLFSLREAQLKALRTPAADRERVEIDDTPNVHSVLPTGFDPAADQLYHGLSCGLRPDLIAQNQMCPGDDRPLTARHVQARISEVLPLGAYDQQNGASLPNEEFIEIHLEQNDGVTWPAYRAALRLEINRERDGQTREFLLPVPESKEYLALGHGRPVCYEESDFAWSAGGLYLPNEPAGYRLYDREQLLSEVRVDARLLAELGGETRRSVAYSFEADLLRATDGEQALVRSACADGVYATPGRPPAFAPFLATQRTQSGIDLTLFEAEAPQLLSLRTRLSPDEAFDESDVWLQNQETIRLASPSGQHRILLEVYGSAAASPLLTAALPGDDQALYFQTISATPGPGEVEWVRVCSPNGFTLSELLFADANSEDSIVPYATRHPGVAPISNLSATDTHLAAGRCAIIVDPDFLPAQTLPIGPEDTHLWTIASSAALGNGLGSGEALLIYVRLNSNRRVLASYGLPDSSASFGLDTANGERVERVAGTRADEAGSFEVRP